MERSDLSRLAADFCREDAGNYISAADARSPEVAGLRIFEAPVFAVGDPADPLFRRLAEPQVVGEGYLTPLQWSPEARSVVSFFLPFTEAVRKSNYGSPDRPSDAWLHGRIEGQKFIAALCARLRDAISGAGYRCVVPALDDRLVVEQDLAQNRYFTNWSERHTAYICGLGTFGLSGGLITERGMAGRLGSLLTDLELPRTPRPYAGVYEYCTRCGKCARNCPGGAITLAGGKAHAPCHAFLKTVTARVAPRYGCGKCQVDVPCESRIPKNRSI